MTIEEQILIVGAIKTQARNIITSLEYTIGVERALPATMLAAALYDALGVLERELTGPEVVRES